MSKQEPQDTSEGSIGQSALTGGLGAAIIVDGVVVAWFAEFTDEAREWCTENYFGRWLVWRAKTPEIVPLTEGEYDEAMRGAKEMAALFEDLPEAPNVPHEGAHAALSRTLPLDAVVGGQESALTGRR